MSRSGTTRTTIRKRRAHAGKAARLTRFLRRFGIISLMLGLIGWLFTWIILSDTHKRVAHDVAQTFYDFTSARGFVVKNVLVEGRHYTDADILRGLLNIERGDPLMAFSPREAKELIERISWVKTVQVERRLPDTIYIGLTERQPLALWQNQGKLRLIDKEGVTLTDHNLDPFSRLIILVGDDAPVHAPDLIRTLEAEPALRGEIEAATWVGERRWDLKMRNGMTVRMPEKDMGLALRRLALAQEKDAILEKDLIVIDLREPHRMTVRTRPGAVTDYNAEQDAGNNI